ncbi:MAG: tetratricopeptide repeat protein, partial [Myxococcota bacterium]
ALALTLTPALAACPVGRPIPDADVAADGTPSYRVLENAPVAKPPPLDEVEAAGSVPLPQASASAVGSLESRLDRIDHAAQCEGGDGLSCVILGVALERGLAGLERDDAAARDAYRRACDAGDGLGCANYGVMLSRGIGGAREVERAREVHEAACEAGEARSCAHLGFMVQAGKGGEVDPEGSVAWLERACRGGSMLGCNNLGHAMLYGIGVAKDVWRARVAFTQACHKGYERACFRMAWTEAMECVAERPSACNNEIITEPAMMPLLEELCRSGASGDACAALGSYGEVGRFVVRAPDKARAMYQVGCDDLKSGWACMKYARMLVRGEGGEPDPDKAKERMAHACASEHVAACRELGLERIGGAFGVVEVERGVEDVRRACDAGMAMACRDLRVLCALGLEQGCEDKAQD